MRDIKGSSRHNRFLQALAVVLLVQFLSLRVRNSALPGEERDPHLGRKFALGVFLHLAIMLMLTGLTVSFSETFDGLFGGKKNQFGTTPMTRPMGPGGPGGPGWPPRKRGRGGSG